MTRYDDMIQKMTFEEMASFIAGGPQPCLWCVWWKESCDGKLCEDGVKKWLMENIKAGGLEDMKTEWIPVTERLPGNYETVLVWIAESRIYDVAIYDTINGFRPWYSGYYEDCPEEWRDPVTAWMPLPKPYKETNK